MAGGNKGATLQGKLRGDLLSYPVDANKVIFRGAAVCAIDATGGAAHDITAKSRFIGMAEEYVNNASPGVLGTKSVRVRRRGVFRFQLTRTVAQENPNAAAAVDKADGLNVGIPITGTAFAAVDYVTIAGSVAYNGTFYVSSKTTNEIVIEFGTFVAETFAGTETVDIAKCVPAAVDLGKVAYLATIQAAAIEEQVHVLPSSALGQDKIILGPIVKVDAAKSPHVWIDVMAGGLRGGNFHFASTVTAITCVDGLIVHAAGS